MRRKVKSIIANTAKDKTAQVIIAVLIFGLAGTFWYIAKLSEDLIESAAISYSQTYSAALEEFRTIYTSEVVSKAQNNGLEISHDYIDKDSALPLPATLSMLLAKRIGEKGGNQYAKLYSDYPFPWREEEGGAKDQFERDAIDFLTKNPRKEFYKFENYKGRASLRYATADVMRESCIQCHNNHPDTPKSNWKTGDVRGVLEVVLPLEAIALRAQNDTNKIYLLLTVLLFGIVILSSALIWQIRKQKELIKNKERKLKENIEQFNYISSHDLQEPLRMITSYSQLIKLKYQDKVAPDLNELIGYIIKGSEKMKSLYQELNSFSNISNKICKFKQIDSAKLLDDIITTKLEALAEAKGTKVPQVNYKDLPIINADAEQIHQLFLQLLDNALKFRRKDHDLEIKISARKDDDVYIFAFEDNGIGIEKDHTDKIFSLFQRISIENNNGTGIGLAKCKQIINNHGGEIWVNSTHGKKTTIFFSLPINSQSQDELI